jgi:hypothetical protein
MTDVPCCRYGHPFYSADTVQYTWPERFIQQPGKGCHGPIPLSKFRGNYLWLRRDKLNISGFFKVGGYSLNDTIRSMTITKRIAYLRHLFIAFRSHK